MVFRIQPVAGVKDHDRPIVRGLEHFADGLVDRDVDVLDRIADDFGDVGVVKRMRRVIKMPALMTGTMAFGPRLGE